LGDQPLAYEAAVIGGDNDLAAGSASAMVMDGVLAIAALALVTTDQSSFERVHIGSQDGAAPCRITVKSGPALGREAGPVPDPHTIQRSDHRAQLAFGRLHEVRRLGELE